MNRTAVLVGIMCLALASAQASCDYISRLPVANDSPYHLALFLNTDYPDTTLARADFQMYVAPGDTGEVYLINREWRDYFEEGQRATVIYAIASATEGQARHPKVERVLERTVVSSSLLDSMEWALRFPFEE